jgi:molybdopterin molybdotransferase
MSSRRTVTDAELQVPLLAYPDAIARVVASFPALAPVEVPFADSLGLVLAGDVVAADDIPSFDNSAMDGYAVRSADLASSSELVVAAEVAPGAAAKVMTGFPIPDGADAVVPWERTSGGVGAGLGDTIRIDGPVTAGAFVRPTGEDVRRGDTVLRAGTRIGPVEVAMLATLGCVRVRVHPAPRVGVLSTGDELVGVDEPVGRGRIRDANAPLLAAACTRLGAVVTGVRRAVDDPDAIATALAELAADADLVVSTGGASVGERDWLRAVLERHAPLTFWKVALRPGKPVALGSVDGVPVLVLPGNPGSVVACTHVFVTRAVRALAGRDPEPRTVPGTLAAAIRGDEQRTVVHPVRLDAATVTPVAGRSSQVLSTALGAQGFVIVAPGGLDAGAAVAVELDE